MPTYSSWIEKCVRLSWRIGSVAQLYISLKNGGRVIRSVDVEYKSTKIKAAVKLFENPDTTMSAVRKFEEQAVQTRRHSIIQRC